MPRSVYYVQECPTCGRRLEVRVQYLGRNVVCQHCRGNFVAQEPSNGDGEFCSESGTALLRRVEELLHLAEQQRDAV